MTLAPAFVCPTCGATCSCDPPVEGIAHEPCQRPDPIIEGTLTPTGWEYRTIDPLEACPACGYAQGAHTAADLSCPDEAQASAVWGR